MGLFSSTKTVTVSSTVYNLAGDIASRPDFLKTTMIGIVMGDSDDESGQLVNSYTQGPGLKLRRYGQWARTSDYVGQIGQTESYLLLSEGLDENIIKGQIPHNDGDTVNILGSSLGPADFTYWARQYMQTFFPDVVEGQGAGGWYADFVSGSPDQPAHTDPTTGIVYPDVPAVAATVILHWPGHADVTITPEPFDPNTKYIYASYKTLGPSIEQSSTTGDVNTVTAFASLTGYNPLPGQSVDNPLTANENNTVHTVVHKSDGSADVVTDTSTPVVLSWTETLRVYENDTYQGSIASVDTQTTLKKFRYDTTHGVPTSTAVVTTTTSTSGGVTTTTTKTTTTWAQVPLFTTQINTATFVQHGFVRQYTFIYQQNSGNSVLDALFSVSLAYGRFMAFIPVRIDNAMIGEYSEAAHDLEYPGLVPWCQQATLKSTGGKWDDIVTKLKTNASIGDIDYAYISFGVSINSQEPACRAYLWQFFQNISVGQDLSGVGYEAWIEAWTAAQASQTAHSTWATAQGDPTNPLYGTPEPEITATPAAPYTEIRIFSSQFGIHYDMTIYWSSIKQVTGSGQLAAVGLYWWIQGSSQSFDDPTGVDGDQLMETSILYWQETAETWHRLEITGLNHVNNIYQDKSVYTDAFSAIAQDEESGFIIPLHEDIFRSMPLVVSTQMSTACAYLVVNSYVIVKQEWYESGLFQILLIVVIIVISILTWGAGSVLGAGVLGTDAAVGASLGLVGTAAIIVGAIANAIAAVVISQIISIASKAAFGDEIGGIIGSIASFIVVAGASAAMSGQSVSQAFQSLTSVSNLMKLTEAVGQGVTSFENASTAAMIKTDQASIAATAANQQTVDDLIKANTPQTASLIDPASFTPVGTPVDTNVPPAITVEPPSQFLNRTLLTGSDLAGLTNGMIGSFADINLDLTLPIGKS